jgi:hypothetical protein
MEETARVTIIALGIIMLCVGGGIYKWIRSAGRDHGIRLLLYSQSGVGRTTSVGPGPDLSDPDEVLKTILFMVTSAGAWVDKDAEITRLLHRHNELREGVGMEKLW